MSSFCWLYQCFNHTLHTLYSVRLILCHKLLSPRPTNRWIRHIHIQCTSIVHFDILYHENGFNSFKWKFIIAIHRLLYAYAMQWENPKIVSVTITATMTTTIKCIQVKVSVLTPFISNLNTNNMWNADGVWNMRKMSVKSYKFKNTMKQFMLFSA